MGITVEGQVGPRVVQDGSNTEVRQGRTGAIVSTDAHGRYHEATSRGGVFSISTGLAGTTVIAANNSPVGAAAASILTLYNPLGSGINASILKIGIGVVSGTPAAGGWGYNVAYNQTITASQNATPVANYVSGKNSNCRGFTQTALTGSGVQVLLRSAAYHQFAGAVAATTPGLYTAEEIAGEIVVPPGGILSLASPGTGTTVIVYSSIVFEEIPV